MGQNLGPLNIKDTYQDLVQTSGSVFTDGTGNVITNVDITASYASTSGYATSAGNAGTAATAVSASHAIVADSAISANTATSASHAVNADSADSAIIAASAISASHALVADAVSGTIENAVSASYVLGSGVDGAVALATTASHANNADTATFATSAATASIATSALLATSASHAVQADSATSASHALVADSVAGTIENAVTASYILGSGVDGAVANATSASHAVQADSATTATTANQATTAISATDALNADRLKMTATATSNEHPLVLRSINPGSGDYYNANYDSNFFGSAITYNPATQKLTVAAISSSGVISANSFTGDLTGTSSWALGSNYATEVGVINDDTNSTRYITFVDTTTGQDSVRTDAALTYNPQTNQLVVRNLSVPFDITADRIDATTITGSNALIENNLAIEGIPNVSQSIADAAASGGGAVDTGSLMLTGSVSDATLTFTKGDNTTTFDLTVDNVANATNATSANEVTVSTDVTNADRYVSFVDTTTGTDFQRVDATFTYNPSTNKLSLAGDLAIGGIADVSSSIASAAQSGGGGSADTGSLLVTASISDATVTFTKGDASTFDITVDNVTTANTASYVAGANVDGAVANATNATDATNADNIAVASDATDADRFVTFVATQTGDEAVLTDAGIKYNPSTNKLTTTGPLAIEGITDVSASIAASGGGGGSAFPFTGDAVISGSLNVSSSVGDSNVLLNSTDTYTSTEKINEVVTLTQAEYNGITPDANTLYVISDNTGSLVVSASHALVADTVVDAGVFPYTGDAEITGSLNIDGWLKVDHLGVSGSDLRNLAIGTGSLANITSGIRNTAMGSYYLENPASDLFAAGYKITSGNDNTFYGAGAGTRVSTGTNNTAIGVLALGGATTGTENVALGGQALRSGNGSYNIGIGKWSGYSAAGQENIYIGYRTAFQHTGWRSIILGANAIGQGGSALSTNDWFIVGQDLEVYDNLIHGKTAGTKYLGINGALQVSGSLVGTTSAITPSSSTGSMDCSTSNFFTMTLDNGTDVRLEASNIQAGQTINLKLTNNATAAGTISFGSSFEFEGGTAFTATAATNAVDVMTFISFDGSSLQATGLKNLF